MNLVMLYLSSIKENATRPPSNQCASYADVTALADDDNRKRAVKHSRKIQLQLAFEGYDKRRNSRAEVANQHQVLGPYEKKLAAEYGSRKPVIAIQV